MKGVAVRIIMITILMIAAPAVALALSDGGAAGGFLYAGSPGARSAGMANSSAADGDGASGAYFNPALITAVKHTEAEFYYMSPADGFDFNVFGFAMPVMDYGIMSFTRAELKAEGVERITSEGIKTGDFSDLSDAYMLTYAYPVTGSLSLGLTLKLITRSFDTSNANGFGVDAGASYDFGGVFRASLAVINAAQPAIKIGTETETYPMDLRLGGALYLFDSKLALTGGLLMINVLSDGREFAGNNGRLFFRPSGGAELKPFDFIAVRGGWGMSGPAAGAGIITGNFTLDYAASFTEQGVVHNFGVTALFGEVPSEREKKLVKEKEALAGDRLKLEGDLASMSFEQIYLLALNNYNTGNYEKARVLTGVLQKSRPGDAKVEKLAADTRVALNRAAAGARFDEAVPAIVKGDAAAGMAIIKEAEKLFPGITGAKIKEYMDNGAKEIDNRRYMNAKKWYESVLAVDPSNAKAAEMLGKLRDLQDMAK